MATLTIGDTANNTTAIHIYIKNHTTGVLTRFDSTTSGTGLVTLDITDFNQIENHDYEIWITLASATNIDERVTVVIDGTNYTCVAVTFTPLYDDEGALITGLNQTLKAV